MTATKFDILSKNIKTIQFNCYIFNESCSHWLQSSLLSNLSINPNSLDAAIIWNSNNHRLIFFSFKPQLQSPHLSFIFIFLLIFNCSLSITPQIDLYGIQWDSFLSVFPVLSVMAQARLPNPNQMSARDRE